MAKVDSIEVSVFCTNCFLVVGKGGAEAALIDPGDDPDAIDAMIKRSGAAVKYLIATHCHLDHIGAAAEMSRRLGIGLMAGREDEFLLDRIDDSCALFGLPPVEKPSIETYIEEGMELPLGESFLAFRNAPGHTPGSFVVVADNADAVVGDVIFQGSVGRTDLPGGDMNTLKESIRSVILPLGDETVLHTGHGPSTTVGREKQANFFLLEWGLNA
jgi:glyoxylase-like metal-dependent hydrolase (beta-lactamase superfamily II)